MPQRSLSLTVLFVLGCSSGHPLASSGDAAPPDGDSSAEDTGVTLDSGTSADVRTGEDAAPLLAARSFLVEGKLVVKPAMFGGGGLMPPERHDFLLRLDPAAKLMILGGRGTARSAAVKSSDGVTFETTAPVTAAVPDSNALCGAPRITYDRLTALVRGDRVEGTGHGMLQVIAGDQVFTHDTTITFTGGPDTVAPSVGADGTVDPLHAPAVWASEPLPAASTARLIGPPGGTVKDVPLQAIAEASAGGVVTGFGVPDATALVYGASYEVMLEGPRTDLAGNAVVARSARIATPAPPPLLPAGTVGFEDAPGTVGGAAVVDASFLPPITGQRSLFLAPSGANGSSPGTFPVPANRRFTARLTVPASATRIRLRARAISSAEMVVYGGGVSFTAAVPGGGIRTAPALDWRGPLVRRPVPLIGGQDLFLGETRDVEVPLPAHAGEVVLDVSVGFPAGACGLLPPTLGLLLDDLRAD